MFKIHKLPVPGFMITILYFIRFGINYDTSRGKCASILLGIYQAEIVFSLGLRNKKTIEMESGYGQA